MIYLVADNTITRIDANSFLYHKQDKVDKSAIIFNKYISNCYIYHFYTDFDFLTCSCHSYYKFYNVFKLAELYNVKLKEYNKVPDFSTNSRG